MSTLNMPKLNIWIYLLNLPNERKTDRVFKVIRNFKHSKYTCWKLFIWTFMLSFINIILDTHQDLFVHMWCIFHSPGYCKDRVVVFSDNHYLSSTDFHTPDRRGDDWSEELLHISRVYHFWHTYWNLLSKSPLVSL